MSLNRIATNLGAQAEAMIRKQENGTSPPASGSEAARVRNAHDFIIQALGHLEDGDYSGYLCCIDLAGQFARDARGDMYNRTHP